MKLSKCKVCLIGKNRKEFPKGKHTCTECFHLFRCYVCKDVFVKEEHRNNTRCNKCDNKVHEDYKKKNPTEAYKEKVRRNSKLNWVKRRPEPKPKMTKEEAKSLERMRWSVHRIFKRWYIQKKGKSFNYLPYTREEYINKLKINPL